MENNRPIIIKEGANSIPLFPTLQPIVPKGPTVSRSASEVVDIITRQAKLPRDNGELYEVVIKDTIKEGMKQGKYTWNGAEATIRDAKTKSVKGHINVKDVSPSSIEKLSGALTSVVGEIQLAQIMAKLDEIQKTVEEVNRKIDAENSSKLFGTVNTIKQALSMDHIERKLRMLENAIQALNESAEYYLQLYSDQMKIEPERHSGWDMLEGITEKFDYKPGTEQFFMNTTKKFDKATNNFILYMLSMGSLIKVYQVLEHYTLCQNAVDSVKGNIVEFEKQISNKARFYFNITDSDNLGLVELLAKISETYEKYNFSGEVEILRGKVEQNKQGVHQMGFLGSVQFEICEGEF